MRVIDLKKVDKDSVNLYYKFIQQVEGLLKEYKEKDSENYQKIVDELAKTNGNWDMTIDIIDIDGTTKKVEISQLLAYEYCKGIEGATKGKVTFNFAMNRLFSEVNKFRIGNPKEGEDDVCLYGKKLDDETAIPVTTKMYRMVMHAGAQHLDYVRDGKIEGAVFIYEKQTIPDVAKDVRKGKGADATKELVIPGLNFEDLNDKDANGGVQLLTNLRQLAFHEWTHSMEKDAIETENTPTSTHHKIDYEFSAPDGRKYINYRKVKSFYQFKEGGDTAEKQEPTYVYDDYIDGNGKMKSGFLYIENGKRYVVGERPFKFDLEDGKLENEIAISTGLSTVEIGENNEEIMHNIITEGWVESTARAIIEANNLMIIGSIGETEADKELYVSNDIDKGKYRVLVEMADRIIEGRDSSIGSIGQTRADFFSHSSLLKKELEGIRVQKTNGDYIDGLHYCADYADADQTRIGSDFFDTKATPIKIFLSKMNPVAHNLGLSKSVVDILREPNGLFEQFELSEEQVEELTNLLNSGTISDSAGTIAIAQQVGLASERIAEMQQEVSSGNLVELRKKFVDSLVSKYTSLLIEQKEFLDGIPEKLGYKEKDKSKYQLASNCGESELLLGRGYDFKIVGMEYIQGKLMVYTELQPRELEKNSRLPEDIEMPKTVGREDFPDCDIGCFVKTQQEIVEEVKGRKTLYQIHKILNSASERLDGMYSNVKQKYQNLQLDYDSCNLAIINEQILNILNFVDNNSLKPEQLEETLSVLSNLIDNMQGSFENLNNELEIEFCETVGNKIQDLLRNNDINSLEQKINSIQSEKVSLIEKIFGKDKLNSLMVENLKKQINERKQKPTKGYTNMVDIFRDTLSYIETNGMFEELKNFLSKFNNENLTEEEKLLYEQIMNQQIEKKETEVYQAVPLFSIKKATKKLREELNIHNLENSQQSIFQIAHSSEQAKIIRGFRKCFVEITEKVIEPSEEDKDEVIQLE